jgi:GTP:adenosylcobinamide-phosphate guanylyltransferase
MIATITAGGRVDGALREAIGTDVKALAMFDGVTMLERAIAAARGAGAERTIVVGGPEVRARCGSLVDEVVDERPEGRDNVRRAIESAGGSALLLMTSDMPFVDAASLATFLEAAAPFDIALPLAEASEYLARFPDAPPHLTKIGSDRVANGSVVWFAPGVADRALVAAQRLFDARKSLIRMAMLLGPALLARYLAGALRIEHIETRAERVLGVRGRGIRNMPPELCFDVDTDDDYRYAARAR